MKIIRNEIRPVGYITIEFSEAEIQTIIGVMEQVGCLMNRPLGEIKGIRGEIYNRLLEVIKVD